MVHLAFHKGEDKIFMPFIYRRPRVGTSGLVLVNKHIIFGPTALVAYFH